MWLKVNGFISVITSLVDFEHLKKCFHAVNQVKFSSLISSQNGSSAFLHKALLNQKPSYSLMPVLLIFHELIRHKKISKTVHLLEIIDVLSDLFSFSVKVEAV